MSHPAINIVGVLVLAAVIVMGVIFISHGGGYPHACDRHGGIVGYFKGLYFCKDGHKVGAGWLWLHHRTVAP